MPQFYLAPLILFLLFYNIDESRALNPKQALRGASVQAETNPLHFSLTSAYQQILYKYHLLPPQPPQSRTTGHSSQLSHCSSSCHHSSAAHSPAAVFY